MKDAAKEMAYFAYKALEEKKAEDIQIIDIGSLSAIADYFVIANGNSTPQVEAMLDAVEYELAQKGYQPKRIEGIRTSGWILMDYGDVVIHIFSKEDRLFYDLERIWNDGSIVSPEALK